MARNTSPINVTAAAPAHEPSDDRDVEQIVAEIGPRLKALRAELGLSLQQMSAIAEVSAASIHKIERGDMVPTITTLLKLASAFRRPLSDLIDERPVDSDAAWHTQRGAGQPSPFGAGEAGGARIPRREGSAEVVHRRDALTSGGGIEVRRGDRVRL